MMTSFLPKSRSGQRRTGERCDSSHDSFSCLEEDVINEDSSKSENSDVSGDNNETKKISQSVATQKPTKMTPYQQSAVEPLENARFAKGNRLRPLAPMSHKSTAGSSSIKSNYSGQYRGNRALNSKAGAVPNPNSNKSAID